MKIPDENGIRENIFVKNENTEQFMCFKTVHEHFKHLYFIDKAE